MRYTPLIPLALALALAAGCIDEPSDASAECVAHADCGDCGRCANGRCIYDEIAVAQPTCETEAKDPCNGLDDDGDGVVDDPDSCWVPTWELADPATAARCVATDPDAPPAACAGYEPTSSAPAFYLAKTQLPGTLPVRQCHLGEDAVLVLDEVEPGPFGDWPLPLDQPVIAYEALGYTCGAPLGYVFVGAGPGDVTFGSGRACPLYTYATEPSDDAVLGLHRYVYADDAALASGACDPRATLRVVTPRACDAAPPDDCAFDERPPLSAATAASPSEDPVVAPGEPFTMTFTLTNTGDTTWLSEGWALAHVAGTTSDVDAIALDAAVPPGAPLVVTVPITAPEAGIDVTEAWALQTPASKEVIRVTLSYDVATPYAAHVVNLDPPFKAHLPPGTEFTTDVTLDNVGEAPWLAGWRLEQTHGALAANSSVALDADVPPGGSVTLEIPMKVPDGIYGGFNEKWELRDGDGHLVPIDGAAELWMRIHAVGDAVAYLIGETILDDTIVVPGVGFIKTWTFRNDGDAPWGEGWTFRRANGDLGVVASVALAAPVQPQQELMVAVPMVAPASGGAAWRESWRLVDSTNTVVPVTGGSAGSGEFIGADPDWWFWGQVIGGTPTR